MPFHYLGCSKILLYVHCEFTAALCALGLALSASRIPFPSPSNEMQRSKSRKCRKYSNSLDAAEWLDPSFGMERVVW